MFLTAKDKFVNEIAPMVQALAKQCQTAGIPFFALFQLAEDNKGVDYATVIQDPDGLGHTATECLDFIAEKTGLMREVKNGNAVELSKKIQENIN